MQLIRRASRPTPHVALRLAQATSLSSIEPRRSPCWHCGDAMAQDASAATTCVIWKHQPPYAPSTHLQLLRILKRKYNINVLGPRGLVTANAPESDAPGILEIIFLTVDAPTRRSHLLGDEIQLRRFTSALSLPSPEITPPLYITNIVSVIHASNDKGTSRVA